ncbi:hypothetical protein HDV03_000989 [Kappamyces sp. JEL0829]|nr:hypothetical protein HDV03_000989 [Kappamyces sp. JEL0829]
MFSFGTSTTATYDANAINYTQPSTETWPIFYQFNIVQLGSAVYPYTLCGNLVSPLQSFEQCCTSSLDLSATGTFGLASGFDVLINEDKTSESELAPYMPSDANGARYCYLAPSTVSADLFGYLDVFYLADGSCIKTMDATDTIRSARCSTAGTLTLYSDDVCTADPETLPLNATRSLFSNTTLAGSVFGKLVTIQGGTTTAGWTSFQPGTLLLPDFRNPSDLIGLLLLVLSLMGNLSRVVYAGWKYSKSRKSPMILLFVSQFMWLAWIALIMCYYYVPFPTLEDSLVLQIPMFWCFNLASLLSVVYTTQFFCKMTNQSRAATVAIYAGIILIHLGLAWPVYAMVAEFSHSFYGSNADSFILLMKSQLLKYWAIVMFVWDMVPLMLVVVLLLYRIHYGSPVWRLAYFVLTVDAAFLLLFLGQTIIVVLFYLCLYAETYSSVLANDRNTLLAAIFRAFLESLHSVLNCFMIERLGVVIEKSRHTMSYGTGEWSRDSTKLRSGSNQSRPGSVRTREMSILKT